MTLTPLRARAAHREAVAGVFSRARAGEVEVYLCELALGGGLHGIGIVAQDHALFAFDQDLTPNGEHGFVKTGVVLFFVHWLRKIARDALRPLQEPERSLCSLD